MLYSLVHRTINLPPFSDSLLITIFVPINIFYVKSKFLVIILEVIPRCCFVQ